MRVYGAKEGEYSGIAPMDCMPIEYILIPVN